MSEYHFHSFDRARERSAPRELTGATLAGTPWRRHLDRVTLVVAVKPECDGCRDFVEGNLEELSHVDVIVVSAEPHDEWRAQRRAVVVSPESFEALEIPSAPFYVLVDATHARVVGEGTLFSPAQVAQEIAGFLTT
ncbi:MAG: hypothetical protein WA359_11780 [Acidimicrobiales bacterium]